MTARSGGLLRRWLDALLHIDDTPHRTAAAYALGVFFGFSPFLGLHTVLAIACAFALNLNRVAVLLGVYSNLPWIIVAYYAGVTMFGSVLTSVGLPADFRERLVALFELSIWKATFWEQLALLMRPLFWPYVVGSLIGATVLAIAAYPLALSFVSSRRLSKARETEQL
jgi:uncharacterized protein (DUF2062 family)